MTRQVIQHCRLVTCTIGQNTNQCTNNFTVFNTSRFYCDVTIDGNVSVGGDLDVTGDGNFGGDLDVTGDGHIGGDLTVDNNIKLGGLLLDLDGNAPDFDFGDITVDNIQINGGINVDNGATIGGGLDVDNINLSGTITGGDGIFDKITVDTIEGGEGIFDKINVEDIALSGTITGGDGIFDKIDVENIDLSGTITGGDGIFDKITSDTIQGGDFIGDSLDVTGNINFDGFITGDGSQLENLNIPDSLSFKGDIDITAAPPTAENGDFYLVVESGTANDGYAPGITGDVDKNTFIYYSVDAANPGGYKWFPGANTDDEGLVSVNGQQLINGTKTFTTEAFGDYDITDASPDNTLLNKKFFDDNLGDLDLGDLHDVELDPDNPTKNILTQKNQVLWLDYDKTDQLGSLTWQNVSLNTAMVPLVNPDGSEEGASPFGWSGEVTPVVGDITYLETIVGSGGVDEGLVLPKTPFFELPDHDNLQSQAGANDWFHRAIHENYLYIHENDANIANLRDTADLQFVCDNGSNTTTSITIDTDKIVLGNLGDGTFARNGSFGGTLVVTGATTLSSTLDVDGDTTLTKKLDVTGATTLGNTLGVTGATTLSSTLDVSGKATLADELSVAKATTLSSTLDVTGATTLGNTLGVASNTTVGGTLGVSGKATLADELSVAKATTLSSTLDVSGNTTVGGTLGVTGAISGDSLALTNKGTSAVTESTDSPNTLITKGYTEGLIKDVEDKIDALDTVVGALGLDEVVKVGNVSTGSIYVGSDKTTVANNPIRIDVTTGKIRTNVTIDSDPADTVITKQWAIDKITTSGGGGSGTAFFWTRSDGAGTLTPFNSGDSLIINGNVTTTNLIASTDVSGATGTFSGAHTANTYTAVGLVKGANVEATGNVKGVTATFTGKATSASTVDGDGGATLTTKDYVKGLVDAVSTDLDSVLKTGNSSTENIASVGNITSTGTVAASVFSIQTLPALT